MLYSACVALACYQTNDPNGYYRRLGLSPGASTSEVKAALRREMMKCHPDTGNYDQSEWELLIVIRELLTDPRTKSLYDRHTGGLYPDRLVMRAYGERLRTLATGLGITLEELVEREGLDVELSTSGSGGDRHETTDSQLSGGGVDDLQEEIFLRLQSVYLQLGFKTQHWYTVVDSTSNYAEKDLGVSVYHINPDCPPDERLLRMLVSKMSVRESEHWFSVFLMLESGERISMPDFERRFLSGLSCCR